MIATVITLAKKINEPSYKKIGNGIAILSCMSFLFSAYSRYAFLSATFTQVLPLALCNILSFILIPLTLIKRNQTLFEFCYYSGIGGASQALITPAIHYRIPFICSIAFYIEHALILLGIFYCLVPYTMKPKENSVIKCWLIICGYSYLSILFNYLLNTNYCYTLHKPHGTNLITKLSPWPWYIPEASLIALLIFSCLYLPFYISRLYKKTRSSGLRF